jgi:8-oxo-dGTP diphosphatase
MNFILFLIAFILVAILTPLGFITAIIVSLLNWNKGILNDYFFNLALSLDQFGNVSMQRTFNLILIKPKSIHKFGNPDETISSVLGKNQKAETLIYLGKRLVVLLDWIEKDHSLKSIDQ